MPTFLPGRELSRRFFTEAIAPILAGEIPGLRCAVGLLGGGSEVLGFDTDMSTDHDWGPRVQLFVHESEHTGLRDRIDTALRDGLPHQFHGFPTRVVDGELQDPRAPQAGSVPHRVEITTARRFLSEYLGFDPGPHLAGEIAPADWLTFPEQKLRTLSDGPVFHDDIGLVELRQRFAYYPHDLWLYLLASAWARLGEEEHLMGRAGIVGDDLGSALIAARIVRDLMRLAFLMERTFAPYPKWFGTAFARLGSAAALQPHLGAVLAARTWQEREHHLVPAYRIVAERHNRLALTDPIPSEPRTFFTRPFRVIALNGFADGLLAQIRDDRVRRLATRPLIGGIDLLSDSTALVEGPEWRPVLRELYR